MRKCSVVFTGKISAANESYVIGEDKDVLYSSFIVRLETTEGEKLAISDETSPVGMLDGKTRYDAVKKAKAYLEELKENYPERVQDAG